MPGFDGTPITIAPSSLPLVLQLPENAGTDPACATLCDDDTGFLVRFKIGWAGRSSCSVARVEPPWYFVTGEEALPSFCFNGKPTFLKFGLPSACVFTFGGDFSIATNVPNPPPARVVIQPSDVSNQATGCSLFPRGN